MPFGVCSSLLRGPSLLLLTVPKETPHTCVRHHVRKHLLSTQTVKTTLTEHIKWREQQWRASISVEDCVLHVVEGPHQGRELPLRRELTLIGRGEWCDLVLRDDRSVSLEHCELRLTPQGLRLRDLRSRNGIFCDALRVVDVYLHPGASFSLGETRCQLRSEGTQQEVELCYYDESLQLAGKSPAMRRIFGVLPKLAAQEIPVLLTGETGTGKSRLAQILHEQSPRREGPFVVVNCGALSPSLVESLLFGHEKGAFTGAAQAHKGFLEQADGGTLFLDEIGDLPLELQPKLLDVLERKSLRRLGGEREREVDFRLLSATHRDLQTQIKQNLFRQDLYYRLAVVELEVPPLRERPEDIPLLADVYLQQLDPSRVFQLHPRALQHMTDYLWPGNVRQLFNVLQRASVFQAQGSSSQQGITYLMETDVHLPEQASEEPKKQREEPGGVVSSQSFYEEQLASGAPLKALLEASEQQLIELALVQNRWKIQDAASALGISRNWLYKRMKKYDIG